MKLKKIIVKSTKSNIDFLKKQGYKIYDSSPSDYLLIPSIYNSNGIDTLSCNSIEDWIKTRKKEYEKGIFIKKDDYAFYTLVKEDLKTLIRKEKLRKIKNIEIKKPFSARAET